MSDSETNRPQENNAAGVTFALAAFTIWGLIPIFYKQLSQVPALEFLGYRIMWSFVFLIFMLFFRRTFDVLVREIVHSLRDRKLMLLLGVTASLISSNWLVYIWAIAHDHVLEASLGYFINPLMNVALGLLLLGERLSRTKLVAVGLATSGVVYMILAGGEFPWIALYLSTSFALYGLIRKKIRIGAIIGLWIEMLLLLPVALAYLFYLGLSTPPGTAGYDNYIIFMLVI
ncbi:MAG: EamA family transporter RarD, partial [Alphaproteobacteria bacterium]|nr:EamA family transporter RarD [Alphaproteobacteria bacterium]